MSYDVLSLKEVVIEFASSAISLRPSHPQHTKNESAMSSYYGDDYSTNHVDSESNYHSNQEPLPPPPPPPPDAPTSLSGPPPAPNDGLIATILSYSDNQLEPPAAHYEQLDQQDVPDWLIDSNQSSNYNYLEGHQHHQAQHDQQEHHQDPIQSEINNQFEPQPFYPQEDQPFHHHEEESSNYPNDNHLNGEYLTQQEEAEPADLQEDGQSYSYQVEEADPLQPTKRMGGGKGRKTKDQAAEEEFERARQMQELDMELKFGGHDDSLDDNYFSRSVPLSSSLVWELVSHSLKSLLGNFSLSEIKSSLKMRRQ